MHKKILFGLILALILVFTVNFSFATEKDSEAHDAINGIRNMVGDAENGIEDAAKDISNTSKEATGDMENGTSNEMTESNENDSNGMVESTTGNNGNYTAERTSATTDESLLGMNSTTWIWLIMAILAIAIIALVYYYTSTMNTKNYDDE